MMLLMISREVTESVRVLGFQISLCFWVNLMLGELFLFISMILYLGNSLSYSYCNFDNSLRWCFVDELEALESFKCAN